jgi:hypothetical protein
MKAFAVRATAAGDAGSKHPTTAKLPGGVEEIWRPLAPVLVVAGQMIGNLLDLSQIGSNDIRDINFSWKPTL